MVTVPVATQSRDELTVIVYTPAISPSNGKSLGVVFTVSLRVAKPVGPAIRMR